MEWSILMDSGAANNYRDSTTDRSRIAGGSTTESSGVLVDDNKELRGVVAGAQRWNGRCRFEN